MIANVETLMLMFEDFDPPAAVLDNSNIIFCRRSIENNLGFDPPDHHTCKCIAAHTVHTNQSTMLHTKFDNAT